LLKIMGFLSSTMRLYCRIRPVDGKKIGADFIVGSGHKSMVP